MAEEVVCTLQTCPISDSALGYIPSLGGNVFVTVVFGILVPIQLYFGIRHRTWGFMIGMIGGLLLEIAGYAGRAALKGDPFSRDLFMLQIITLTIAPAFISAAVYLCLGRIVIVYGESFSRLRPRTYSILFIGFDFFSLVLQGGGGGLAASSDDDRNAEQTGINIMLAGLSIQVFSLLLFMALCAEFAWRAYKNVSNWDPRYASIRPTRLWKIFLICLATATLTIFIRSVFRVAELSAGFESDLARNETTFMILEGVMILIACLALTIGHPGISFQGNYSTANFTMRTRKNQQSGLSTPDEEMTTRRPAPQQ